MPPGADLFIVCKHCGSEVSPYITECPYCGHRLRRRAPKLPSASSPSGTRGGRLGRLASHSPREAPVRERTGGRLSSLSAASAAGVRPYATIAIVAATAVIWVLLRAGFVAADKLVVVGPLHGDWWKLLSGSVSYLNGWFAFFGAIVVAVFGWLLERRHGPIAVLALFFGTGAVGVLAVEAVYPLATVAGGGAGALALLAAWAAPDLLAARGGDYYDGDLLGAGTMAALILAIPFVLPESAWLARTGTSLLVLPQTSWLAGVVGGLLGLLFGLGLARFEQARA